MAYAFATAEQAQRAATLQQEAIEVRNKTWLGRSTVRTLQPGRTFILTDSPLDLLLDKAGGGSAGQTRNDDTRFLVTAVIHAGINNLPKSLSDEIATRLGGGRSNDGNTDRAGRVRIRHDFQPKGEGSTLWSWPRKPKNPRSQRRGQRP